MPRAPSRASRCAWILALLAAQALAAERTRIVVLPITASSEKMRPVAGTIAEQVLTELARTERLEVMGASDVEALLGMERQRQMMGCADAGASCFAEMSAALGAPYIVTGSLGQLGKAMRLDLKLIRATDAKVLFRGGQSFSDETKVFDAVSSIVEKLVKKIDFAAEPKVAPPPPTPRDAPVVAAVMPPVGPPVAEPLQVVAPAEAPPTSITPWVVAGGGGVVAVVGAVLVGVGRGNYQATHTHITSLTIDQALRAYEDANTLTLAGVTTAAVGVAVAGVGLTWALTRGPGEEAATVTITPGPTSLMISGAF